MNNSLEPKKPMMSNKWTKPLIIALVILFLVVGGIGYFIDDEVADGGNEEENQEENEENTEETSNNEEENEDEQNNENEEPINNENKNNDGVEFEESDPEEIEMYVNELDIIYNDLIEEYESRKDDSDLDGWGPDLREISDRLDDLHDDIDNGNLHPDDRIEIGSAVTNTDVLGNELGRQLDDRGDDEEKERLKEEVEAVLNEY